MTGSIHAVGGDGPLGFLPIVAHAFGKRCACWSCPAPLALLVR